MVFKLSSSVALPALPDLGFLPVKAVALAVPGVHVVIPSEARSPPQKQRAYEIPRFARDDTLGRLLGILLGGVHTSLTGEVRTNSQRRSNFAAALGRK